MRKLFKESKCSGFFHILTNKLEMLNRKYFILTFKNIPRPIWEPAVNRGPELQCQRANLPERISPSKRLTLTFRWLASGESSQPLSFAFKINGNTTSNILADIFEKIWKMLSNTYVHAPSSEVDWLTISDGYFDNWNSNWNRVHCTGAIDGELIARECPKISGCTITIIRRFLSLFFMTACDAPILF